MNNLNNSYIRGFVKEAQRNGFSEDQAKDLVKKALNLSEAWELAKNYVGKPVANIPEDWEAWGKAKTDVADHMKHYDSIIGLHGGPDAFKNPVKGGVIGDLENERTRRMQALSAARGRSLYGLGVAGTGLAGAGTAGVIGYNLMNPKDPNLPHDIQGGADNGAYPNYAQNT